MLRVVSEMRLMGLISAHLPTDMAEAGPYLCTRIRNTRLPTALHMRGMSIPLSFPVRLSTPPRPVPSTPFQEGLRNVYNTLTVPGQDDHIFPVQNTACCIFCTDLFTLYLLGLAHSEVRSTLGAD